MDEKTYLTLRDAIDLEDGLSSQRVEVLDADNKVVGELSGVTEVRTYNRVGEVPRIEVDLIANHIDAKSR